MKSILICLSVCFLPVFCHANELVNGSFESPVFTGNPADPGNLGGPVTGWTFSGPIARQVRVWGEINAAQDGSQVGRSMVVYTGAVDAASALSQVRGDAGPGWRTIELEGFISRYVLDGGFANHPDWGWTQVELTVDGGVVWSQTWSADDTWHYIAYTSPQPVYVQSSVGVVIRWGLKSNAGYRSFDVLLADGFALDWSSEASPKASAPSPGVGAQDVPADVMLEWTAGGGLGGDVLHDVYFGESFAAVNAADRSDTTGVYRGAKDAAETMYDPGRLEYGRTYYWRVDEVAGGTTWKGDVWSFTVVRPVGHIEGRGRYERLAGTPSAGYAELYEWMLFVCPDDGQRPCLATRLGDHTYDGWYQFLDVPIGSYSVYLHRPDLFGGPDIVPFVQIESGRTTTQHVNLSVDYAARFTETWTAQLDEWQSPWYQTFVARGTSVKGVMFQLAGHNLYGGKYAHVSILEDNGSASPTQWRRLATATDWSLYGDLDKHNYVVWPSGAVPLVPGRRYAVEIHVTSDQGEDGMALYCRPENGAGYPHGQAYNRLGQPRDFDLNISVFVDRGQTLTTHRRVQPNVGELSGWWVTQTGQSFVAVGDSLAAVDAVVAQLVGADFLLTWTVRRDGPDGPIVGEVKKSFGAGLAGNTRVFGVSYNPGRIPLQPGERYYIEISNPNGFNPFIQPENPYADGNAFRDGADAGLDLAMTIMQYVWPRADLDGDRDVDMIDLATFGGAWQAGQADAAWNPLCDIALPRDSVVDANDLNTFIEDWMWRSPTP